LPVDLETGTRLPDEFRATTKNDRIVCTTCHDLLLQCQNDADTRYRNPMFLRSGHYRPASTACVACHDPADYQKLNPHRQVADGAIMEDSCLFCHRQVPQPGSNSGPDLRTNGTRMCTGCHEVLPHPLSMAPGTRTDEWTHLVAPSTDIVDRMRTSESRGGVRLPLDDVTGEVSCATCHDPHESGVIQTPNEQRGDHRLRSTNVCEACHDI